MTTFAQQGWSVKKPKIEICDDKVMVKQVRAFVEDGVEFILCFVPKERKDHYDATKKVCLSAGVASQFVKERTIKKNMMAVATKVALQMACKFGGQPWAVAMPPHINKKPVMFIGIDVYHDTAKKNDSVFALVASLNKEVTRWYSTHQILSQTEETPGQAVKQMIKLALGAYKSHNGYLPGNVIIYRDGVGDTDLPRVKYQEIDTIAAELKKIAQNEGDDDVEEIKMSDGWGKYEKSRKFSKNRENFKKIKHFCKYFLNHFFHGFHRHPKTNRSQNATFKEKRGM